jgi:hypothetical protein
MKVNKWTLGLAAAGLVTLPAGLQAEENASPSMLTALSSTTISGYVNTSAHWDLGTGNAHPPAYAFNQNKQDGFNLDVIDLTIEKPLDEAQWAAGYRVDLLFGPDADQLGTQSINSDGAGDFGIKQGYVALRAPVGNGLDFKVGVFNTILGYEVFDAGNNPNYTRSWGYTIEPTTHTGVLMSYQFNDIFSAAAGVANTFGPSINDRAFLNDPNTTDNKSESYKTYMGSIALRAPEQMGFLAGSTLYAAVINGFNGGYGENQTSFSVGATLATPVETLKLGVAYDYAAMHNDVADNGADLGGKHAYALAGYVSLQASEKLSLHGRAEYAKFSQQSTYDLTITDPTDPRYEHQLGLAEKMVSLTGTIQYDLWANVLSRLEVRWDHQAGGHYGDAFGGDDPTTDPGHKKNPVLIAANIIYKF